MTDADRLYLWTLLRGTWSLKLIHLTRGRVDPALCRLHDRGRHEPDDRKRANVPLEGPTSPRSPLQACAVPQLLGNTGSCIGVVRAEYRLPSLRERKANKHNSRMLPVVSISRNSVDTTPRGLKCCSFYIVRALIELELSQKSITILLTFKKNNFISLGYLLAIYH